MDRSLPEHNDVRSKVEAVMPGVPGGTILGPLLFILYINDLSVQVHWATRCHLFVDDYLLFWVINPTQDQTQLQDPQRINPPTLPTKSLASFLTGCPNELKRLTYIAFVYSSLEYACVLWDPLLSKDRDNIEETQRGAARWIISIYNWKANVTEHLTQLNL